WYLRKLPDPRYDRIKTLKFLRKFFKDKHRTLAYSVNFLLQLFYVWMVIYTPIYLSQHLGFSWQEIGTIFAVMLTPFLFLPYRMGTYADKGNERNMLMLGFFIAGISCVVIFFVSAREVWLWALLLFSTRIGAATIEVLSDTYFFKH